MKLGLLSMEAGAGTSRFAASMAAALADLGVHVALVNLDSSAESIRLLSDEGAPPVPKSDGFYTGKIDPEWALRSSKFPRCWLLNAARTRHSMRSAHRHDVDATVISRVLSVASKNRDVVLVDLPSRFPATVGAALHALDGVLVVIGLDSRGRDSHERFMRCFEAWAVNAKSVPSILGYVPLIKPPYSSIKGSLAHIPPTIDPALIVPAHDEIAKEAGLRSRALRKRSSLNSSRCVIASYQADDALMIGKSVLTYASRSRDTARMRAFIRTLAQREQQIGRFIDSNHRLLRPRSAAHGNDRPSHADRDAVKAARTREIAKLSLALCV